MSIASLRTHTDAVLAVLQDAGLSVGDADAEGLVAPYVVLYPIPGGRIFGTLENPHEDGEITYQVTCVGISREQTEWLVDKVMVLLNGFSVEGRVIAFVDADGWPGVQRETEISPFNFVATPRFTVTTTPS